MPKALTMAKYIRNKYRAFSIGKRMALLYVLCALLPMIITNLYASNTLNANAQSAQLKAAQKGYEQTHSYLNDMIQRLMRAGDFIALDQTLNTCLYNKSLTSYPAVEQIADMTTILTILIQKKDDLELYNINLYVADYLLYSHHTDIISTISSVSSQD